MSYTALWRKIAIMVKLNLYKKDGEPFKIFGDSEECLGVPYQTSWNWVLNKSTPQRKTVLKLLKALNVSLRLENPIELEHLDDRTTTHEFGRALGVSALEVEGAILSTHDDANPLQRFAFDARDEAWEVHSRISGIYTVDRIYSERRTETRDSLKLNVDTVLPLGDRLKLKYYIHATLEIPSIQGNSYRYNGVVSERSGLMYWVFSQRGVELHDFIFMITERIYAQGKDKFTAKGVMVTMGQFRPAPISATITIYREISPHDS